MHGNVSEIQRDQSIYQEFSSMFHEQIRYFIKPIHMALLFSRDPNISDIFNSLRFCIILYISCEIYS